MVNKERSFENSIEMGFYVNRMGDLLPEEIIILKKVINFRKSPKTEMVIFAGNKSDYMWIRAEWILASFMPLNNLRKIKRRLKSLAEKGYIENAVAYSKTSRSGMLVKGTYSCIRVLPKTDAVMYKGYIPEKENSTSFLQAEAFSTANHQ